MRLTATDSCRGTHAFRNRILAFGAFVACPLFSGCGAHQAGNPILSTAGVSGHVKGGQQPVSGATIQLFAAGSAGPGLGATSLLSKTVTTNASGDFSIASDYKCNSATDQVYLVASGGNPGLPTPANNQALLLMAALGDCQNLASATYVTLNEVTTVAATWSLAQFLGPNAVVGASATNAAGLRNAFLQANLLVDTATGTARGTGLPTGVTVEAAKLYSLANSISNCVNSDGTTACVPLFAATQASQPAPSNTLDAALAIVRNPGRQVTTVFNLATPSPPFGSSLSQAPNDWTMTVTYTGGGLSNPKSVAPDSQGNIWVANFLGGNVSRIAPDGTVSAFPNATLRESTAITVDGQDNAWISNQQSYSTNTSGGTITKLNSSGSDISGVGIYAGGVYYPYAIAASPNGTIWVADYGSSAATLLANDGTALSPSQGSSVGSGGFIGGSKLPFPEAVAVDAQNNAWFGAQNFLVKVTPSGKFTPYSCGSSALGVALDPNGNIWVADGSAHSVVEVAATGTILQTLNGEGGIFGTQGITVDGSGNVWASNYHGSTISEFSPGPSSVALSPSYGFGLDANLNLPIGISPDASGNLWVANSFLDSIVEFVGLAAPVATPRLGLPAKP